MTARQIMSSPVYTVGLDTDVQVVAEKLGAQRISGLLVIDESGSLAGVITESDLLHRVARPHLPPHVNILGSVFFLESRQGMEDSLKKIVGTRARDVMSHPVVTTDPGSSVQDVADLMLEHKIGRIPVVEDGKPVGVITRHDLVTRVLARS